MDARPPTSSAQKTKVAYLVCSHANPNQVVRLVDLLSSEGRGSHVVVHHDGSRARLDRDALATMSRVHLLECRDPIEWGSFAVVEMALRGMRWILENLEVDWVVLLSGQDYPIQPIAAIEDFLDSTAYDGFLSGSPIEALRARSAREARRRYFYRYYRLPGPRWMLATRFANGSPERRWADGSTSLPPFSVKTVPDGGSLYVGVRRIRTPYTSAFRCHRGGFWCTLSTACIVAVDRFVSDNPSYIRHYRRTRVADESFMNTILLNDESFDISRDDMRYIPFPPEGAAHPQILTLGDLGPMLRSGKHFARKFDADVDGAVLDAIDERVHGRPVRSRA